MQQRLNTYGIDDEALRIDPENPELALIPHPVAADPVPVPGTHLSRGQSKAPALLAFKKPGIGLFQFAGALAHPILEVGVEPLQLPCLAVELGEYPDFCPQHFRYYRYRHVVHRAHLIAAKTIQIGNLNGRDEDHCRLLETRML